MDALSLSGIGAEALAQGIQFLYAQAGEVLKRWRDSKDGKELEATGDAPTLADHADQAILTAALEPVRIDFEALELLEPEIRAFWVALSEYAQGVARVDPANSNLLQTTDALRRALEAVIHQRLTFRGESRAESGLDVGVNLDVGQVAGYVAGVHAAAIKDGRVRVTITTGDVHPGGQVVGVTINRGERPGQP